MKSKTMFILLTAVCALIIIIDAFFNIKLFNLLSLMLTEWTVIMGIMAFAVVSLCLISLHVKRITLRKSEWYFSLYLILLFSIQSIIGIVFGSTSEQFSFAMYFMYIPLSSTMYSLLGLWIASAAYRAFRARSLDATIMLISAMIVMIGSTSFGAAISPLFARVSQYIQLIPTTAASRGIMIGGGVGAIAIGIRIILGIERLNMSNMGE